MRQGSVSAPIMSVELFDLCSAVGTRLADGHEKLVTVESCTGGGIAFALTEVAGSSSWFDRALVTYSNQAKQDLASVPEKLIEEHGAVSEPVARAMATGGLGQSCATVSAAVTGIAGPGGGSVDKPVGLVWFAWARRIGGAEKVLASECLRLAGDRHQVRSSSINHALSRLLSLLD